MLDAATGRRWHAVLHTPRGAFSGPDYVVEIRDVADVPAVAAGRRREVAR